MINNQSEVLEIYEKIKEIAIKIWFLKDSEN